MGVNAVRRFAWNDTGDRIAAVSEGGRCAIWDIINAQYTITESTDWTVQVTHL